MYKVCASIAKWNAMNIPNYFYYKLCPKSSVIHLRCFYLTRRVLFKMYVDQENKYAYSIMENKGYTINLDLPNNSDLISEVKFDNLLSLSWTTLSNQDIYETFSQLGPYCKENSLCISNKLFDTFIDNLTDRIKFATDLELEKLFYSLQAYPETESIRTRNYIEVWVALDDECLKRFKSEAWDLDTALKFVCLFFSLNATKLSDFSRKVIQKCASKATRLTPSQLVQTYFFTGVLRKAPYDMHNLEIQLAEHVSSLSIDDLAIIAMGLFKSKTPIRSMDIVKKVIQKISQNTQTIHEVSLAALLKIIRYSMKYSSDNTIYNLLDKLTLEINRLSLMCCVHIALLGTTTLTLHEHCLDRIAEKVASSIKEARLKDLERVMLTFGNFHYTPKIGDTIFSMIQDELRSPDREFEINKHGKSLACCVSYLGILNYHPKDIITKILTPSFLQNSYGKNTYDYGREILTINNTVEIFFKDSNVPTLPPKLVRTLARKYTTYLPDENFSTCFNITEKMILDIFKLLRGKLGGDEYVSGAHILPHYERGDIVLCRSKDGSPVPVGPAFSSFGLVQRPPNEDLWIVLLVIGRNAIIKQNNSPTGLFLKKMSELKTLGYYPAFVQWNNWSNLTTDEEKLEYLENIVQEALENKEIIN